MVQRFTIPLLIFVMIFFCSCNNENQEDITPQSSINDWILQNMQELYLWTEFLPAAPDKTQDPSTFFRSLLFSGDRFSAIFESAENLDNLLNGIKKEAGCDGHGALSPPVIPPKN